MTKQQTNMHGVKKGDIFYTCWGYEQTNTDFFEVVAITEKTATVRQIEKTEIPTDFMSGDVTPVAGQFANEKLFRTKTNSHNGKPSLKNADGYGNSAWIYDGRPKTVSHYA